MSKSERLFSYVGVICSFTFCVIVLIWTKSFSMSNQTEIPTAKEETLGVTKSLTVSAKVGMNLNAYIKPEKRIPIEGNDSLKVAISIKKNGNEVYYGETIADSEGFIAFPGIEEAYLSQALYDIDIKGLSHLKRRYSKILGSRIYEMLDLRFPELKAGDAHISSDNYVNGLDIAYLTNHIYGNDLRSDQNRDGIINSLDYSITISNLYVNGDD